MALAILSKEEQLLWNYQSSCRCGLFSFILLGEAVAGQRKLHYTLRSQFPKAIPSSAGGCAAHLNPQVHLHAGGAGVNLFKSQRQLTACIITSYPCNPWHCFEYVSQ